MRLVDANLLVYAHVVDFAQHRAALTWLDDKLNDTTPLGLPWSSLLAFARLVSNPRIFERPESIEIAWQQVESWLDAPASWIPPATDHHRKVLAQLLKTQGLRANHIPDVHLAALAIEHGLTLCSTDTVFARFPGLSWENPLVNLEF